jgi:hypothetical protein
MANDGSRDDRLLTADAEAKRILDAHPEPDSPAALAGALNLVSAQMTVMQQRSQLLLTLGTLVLTITGFSGPRMAESSHFARYSMSAGIVLVLAAMVILLLSSLRIRWVTQFKGDGSRDTLVRVLHYRNAKTVTYRVELFLLVLGLACYVASVVAFMLTPA